MRLSLGFSRPSQAARLMLAFILQYLV
jgi:hypothetical protein